MPFLPHRRALAIGIFAISSAIAAQQTITVGPTGSYSTIQQGINAANAGDIVMVQPGTYKENVTISGNAITLESSACAGQPAPAGCNAQTIIDGNNQGSVITVSNVLTMGTTISGFTLINGRSGTSGSNAGVSLQTAGAVVSNNALSANAAAISVDNGALQAVGNQITDVIFSGAQCNSANGILLTGTNIMVLDSQGNRAATSILGNVINGGSKCNGGVGINDKQGNDLTIGFNQISGQLLGINVSATLARTYVYNNLITGNSTGGLSISHTTSSPASGPPDTFILSNTFVNNLSGAKSLSGAAGPAELAISGTFSQVEAVNNIFSTNSATNPDVDCAGLPPSSSNPITPLILDHNLFFNSAANGKLGTNGCPVPTGSYGNINANPNFVSSTNFGLASGSPAIDAGNNSFAKVLPYVSDIAGNTRVLNDTGLPSPVVDMGAYEAVPAGGSLGSPQFSAIQATSSSYYLASGNTFTLTAILSHTTDGISFAPTALTPVVFAGSNGTSVPTITDSNGNASASYTLATPGLYAFTVSYAGGVYAPATSIVLYVYVANPLAVSTIGLTSSNNPSLVGQSVTFTVTSNASDGSHPSPVVLADNGTALLVMTTSTGTATYTTSMLAQGSHPLTATFAGDAAHTSGSASLVQLVGNYSSTTTTLVSSANPSVVNQSITLTAQVASANGVPTGTVVFSDGTTQLSGIVPVGANGNATYTTSALVLGSHSLTATYTATGVYANSSGTLTQVVNADPTAAALAVAPQNAAYGTPLTLTATITAPSPATGTPTGSVNFTDGGTNLGSAALSGGAATFGSSTLSAGPHSFGCTYTGSGNYAASTCNSAAVTITSAATTLSIVSSANPSPALTPITFTVTPSSANGTGGSQALPSGAALTLTITPAGGPGTTFPLTTGANGSAIYTSSGLAAGTYTVSATYAGTGTYGASTNSLNEVVVQNATGISLTASPNPGTQNTTESFTATVAAIAGSTAPGGTVTFLDGAVLLSSVSLSSVSGLGATATFQTSALSPGQHSISALYTPANASFGASGPVTISITIAPQDFSISASAPSITIQTEHHSTMQLTLSSVGGFAAPITLSCGATLPAYLQCEIPSSVALSANSNVGVNLTLDTDALANYAVNTRPQAIHGAEGLGGLLAACLLPLGMVGLSRRRRLLKARKTVLLLSALSLVTVLTLLGGCSGKYPGHTPPGTYSIPITASGIGAGSTITTTHTLSITLNVTP